VPVQAADAVGDQGGGVGRHPRMADLRRIRHPCADRRRLAAQLARPQRREDPRHRQGGDEGRQGGGNDGAEDRVEPADGLGRSASIGPFSKRRVARVVFGYLERPR
jgi:hypothetical protein